MSSLFIYCLCFFYHSSCFFFVNSWLSFNFHSWISSFFLSYFFTSVHPFLALLHLQFQDLEGIFTELKLLIFLHCIAKVIIFISVQVGPYIWSLQPFLHFPSLNNPHSSSGPPTQTRFPSVWLSWDGSCSTSCSFFDHDGGSLLSIVQIHCVYRVAGWVCFGLSALVQCFISNTTNG